MKERLTTDNPTTNTENMLNLAYAKDGCVYLRYGVDDVNLCDYVSEFATKQGCNYSANEIMEGACLECECEVNLLYCLGVQAAELRERLKYYEDSEETGQLIIPPCKVGDVVYFVGRNNGKPMGAIDELVIVGIEKTEQGFNAKAKFKDNENVFKLLNFSIDNYGFFSSRKEAEKTLADKSNITISSR